MSRPAVSVVGAGVSLFWRLFSPAGPKVEPAPAAELGVEEVAAGAEFAGVGGVSNKGSVCWARAQGATSQVRAFAVKRTNCGVRTG